MSSPGVEQAVRQPAVAGPAPPEDLPSDAETGKAIGLAAATMAANLVQVVFTVIFTRILGADGYGSLAALLNVTVILFVAGAALQVAAAREATLGRLGRGGELAGTLARWSRHILTALAVDRGRVGARARAARRRHQHRPGVGRGGRADHRRAVAAAVPAARAAAVGPRLPRGRAQRPLRGARPPGRWRSRSSPPGSTSPAPTSARSTSIAVTAAALAWLLRRRLGPPDRASTPHPLAELARGAALPIAALTLVAALQNVDVIMAKHVLDDDASPASTPPPRWPPRPWCGSPSASASGCCRRRPAAPPRGATRARCWLRRSR